MFTLLVQIVNSQSPEQTRGVRRFVTAQQCAVELPRLYHASVAPPDIPGAFGLGQLPDQFVSGVPLRHFRQ